MPFQVFEGNHFQSTLVGGQEHDTGRNPGMQGFFPARGTKTPLISRLQSGKIEFRAWRDEIVPALPGEFKEFARDPGTDHMTADIIGTGRTVSVPIVAGDGPALDGTRGKGTAEHIERGLSAGRAAIHLELLMKKKDKRGKLNAENGRSR
jgi:hypothetical protein